ncbi:MAG TPA: hypothetical protein VHX14_07385 [Thermoanaerobaculia bacterium]|nr:hypothetical protein [Thermoanaerobaculia bacterium]
MMVRAQVTLDREMYRRARKRASELGVSFAEYVRRLVALDIPVPQKKADPSILFALGRSNGSDVAANKAVMIAEAFAAKRTSSSHAGRAKRR